VGLGDAHAVATPVDAQAHRADAELARVRAGVGDLDHADALELSRAEGRAVAEGNLAVVHGDQVDGSGVIRDPFERERSRRPRLGTPGSRPAVGAQREQGDRHAAAGLRARAVDHPAADRRRAGRHVADLGVRPQVPVRPAAEVRVWVAAGADLGAGVAVGGGQGDEESGQESQPRRRSDHPSLGPAPPLGCGHMIASDPSTKT
jgi:hypothetical protein